MTKILSARSGWLFLPLVASLLLPGCAAARRLGAAYFRMLGAEAVMVAEGRGGVAPSAFRCGQFTESVRVNYERTTTGSGAEVSSGD